MALLGILSLFAEVAAQVTYRAVNGRFVWSPREDTQIYEPHPYLVGVLKPGAAVERSQLKISINAVGYRGEPLRQGLRRILCLGGSTTFCVIVSDEGAWPFKLQGELADFHGGPIEVVNAGVPGYTSAENLIQFARRDHYLAPSLVILYQGLNDLRSSHVPDFTTDYSGFHGRLQAQAFRLADSSQRTFLAFPLYLRKLVKIAFSSETERGSVRYSAPDERLGKVYRSNLRSIQALAREYQTPIIFVPQVLRSSKMSPSEPWLPRLAKDSLDDQMVCLNGIMGEVAADTNVPFVREVLEANWTDGDFMDFCHLSPAGCAKMASILSKFIREHQLLPTVETDSRY